MEYNISKLAIIIIKVLNPILDATFEYEKRVQNIKKANEGKKEYENDPNYAVSWMSLENNMNSLDIEDRSLNPPYIDSVYDNALDLYNP